MVFSPGLCSLFSDRPPLATRLEGAQWVRGTSEVTTIRRRSKRLRKEAGVRDMMERAAHFKAKAMD